MASMTVYYAFKDVKVLPSTNSIIAHYPEVGVELAAAAQAAAAKARAKLAAHRDRGDSHITLSKGILDWYVTLVDKPTDGAAAAAYKISFQHDILWGAV